MLWYDDLSGDLTQLRNEMNRLFSNYATATGTSTFPFINIYEDQDTLTIAAEMPGLSKEQVEITYAEGTLTITGKREVTPSVASMTVLRRERSVGAFEKTIRIPVKIVSEKITAKFTNGVLSITLPKAEDAKPKAIIIETK
jgi:HSP20 family protein